MPEAAFISKTRFFVAKLSLRHYTRTVKESKTWFYVFVAKGYNNFSARTSGPVCQISVSGAMPSSNVNSVLGNGIIESAKL